MKHTNKNKASLSHSKEEANQASHSGTQKKNSTKLNSIALGIIKTETERKKRDKTKELSELIKHDVERWLTMMATPSSSNENGGEA